MARSALQIALFISNTLAAIFGSFPNLLVIYLCFSLPERFLRGTRWTLTLQCALEFINCILLTGLQFALHQAEDGKKSILITGYLYHFPVKVAAIVQALYTFLIVLSIFTLPFAFLYRYAEICQSYLRRMFRFHIIVPLVSMLAIVDAIIVSSIFPQLTYIKISLNDSELVDSTEQAIEVRFTRTAFYMVSFFCGFLSLVSIASYVAITVSTKRVVCTIRANMTSAKVRSLQKQLNIVMILQALVPLTFTTLPLFAFILLFFTVNVSIDEHASIILALIHWQPCAHPALYLFFIGQFRRRVFRYDCLKSHKSSSTNTIVINQRH
ncbi:hypothetical protein Tcan_00178 [Toxocara canis]|uniref:Uncharacterized protein n=1 Tax=Toxocara canis TaxID=6265 RepID=A0A0B2VR90_TOXCA|nr:hypothetical protein Tcan_00178 [Toxocara canis]